MRPINVYSASWNLSIAAGGSAQAQFNIPAQGREFKIRSILIDWLIYHALTVYPWRSNPDQMLTVQVGGFPEKIALPFDITAGSVPASNGQYLILSEPGQIFFNSFYCRNSLPFLININNMNVAGRDHTLSIAVEVQDIQQ